MQTPSVHGSAGTRRILIVDDDKGVSDVLSRLIERLLPDCRVETAVDGLAAETHIAAFRPGLVITDLAMPNRNGAELCRWIRGNGFAATKVLVLTSNPYCELLGAAMVAGADAWLAKPPKILELLARVDELMAGVAPSREN